ncbi:MAG TPA: undecaprenyl-diphosphate phosphatase, partial [bacterium]|nr:undecaprenyl-diphosphate phosphatase [bacterium]
MGIIYAVILGAIQGITEFLPISSSGHLVLAQSILPGFSAPGLVFDVVLHAGTLVAVLAYYRLDLIRLARGLAGGLPENENRDSRRWILGLLLATIPAAVVGVIADDAIEALFESPVFTAAFLCVTGLILFLGEWLKSRHREHMDASSAMTPGRWLTVGIAQALAIIPGISRSGSTMAAGLAVGWSRETAARFSFLLMIPAVSGAVLLKGMDMPAMLSSGTVS